MKTRYIHRICAVLLAGIVGTGLSSCISDLDQSPIDPQMNPVFDQQANFAKQYALLGLTGQKGPDGSGDLDGQDEGESGFYRTIFNLNELCTDECAWAWQENQGIPELTRMAWNSSLQRVEWAYTRLGYDILQLNYFLDNIEGRDDAESVKQRAEVRFLRALHYAYFLDLFGKAPFKEHFDNELPVEKAGKDLYDYIHSELAAIEPDMYEPRQAPFGRADKAANWLLRARLCLNAGIYTGTADWQGAKSYATQVIGSGYMLCPDYKLMFMADNDENPLAMQEIILPIRQDGKNTVNHGGSAMLVCGARIAGMPYTGTTNPWSCIFARAAMIQKFFPDLTQVPMLPEGTSTEGVDLSTDAKIDAVDAGYGTRTVDMIKAAGDDRAMFYSGVGGGTDRKIRTTTPITGFKDGLSIVKWQNIRSDGGATHDVKFPDTDIPFLRLSEAYLIRAEACFRTNDNGNALADINVLRNRANAQPLSALTEQDVIDEWAREFYQEGRRRSDLVRFDMFTTNKYLWDWKGGSAEGTAVSPIYNLYPIPESDLNNNKNMTQNPGYGD